MIRNLKNYKWVYGDGQIMLINKRNSESITLSMAMADSFVRAYISFKVRYNIEQRTLLREQLKRQREVNKVRVDKLKERIFLRGSRGGRSATSKKDLPKRKFKKGDEVEVIKSSMSRGNYSRFYKVTNSNEVGKTGVVQYYCVGGELVTVKLDFNQEDFTYKEECLRLIKNSKGKNE